MTGYIVRRTVYANNRIGQTHEYLDASDHFGPRHRVRVFKDKELAEQMAESMGGEVFGYTTQNEPCPGLYDD